MSAETTRPIGPPTIASPEPNAPTGNLKSESPIADPALVPVTEWGEANGTVARLRDLLKHSQRLLGPIDVATLQQADHQLNLLAQREKNVEECSLIVALLGGTKVGKTTLVNALAGRVIGEASAKACFTSRPAVFVHRNREAVARKALAGVLAPTDRVEVHEEKELESIILVDTPDFDGSTTAHRDIFHRVLERADLAICVVTTQKYDAEELYKILAVSMGFRRSIVVFNRTDEGIPLTDAIKKDCIGKFARFQLKAPEGETLPVFAVSALNALLQKLGQGNGPTGEFAALENLLRERLDRALIKRINEENLRTYEQQAVQVVRRISRIDLARAQGRELERFVGTAVENLGERARENVANTLRAVADELVHRRSAGIVDGIGGPFGAYLRATLAIRGLAKGFSLPLLSVSDPAEGMAERVVRSYQVLIQESRGRLVRLFRETADRSGFSGDPLVARFEGYFQGELLAGAVSREIQKYLVAPRVSTLEGFVLNVVPVTIILLLVRYFLVTLLAAREPSAGMFIGTAFIFWLVCHAQTSLWLRIKVGSGEGMIASVHAVFLQNVRDQFLLPVREWNSEVSKNAAKAEPADPA
jgi:GTPase Era involved in 16S rRNA processing